MARPVFGTTARTSDDSIARFDRDRGLVEAARRDPARFDALYRRYLAQVYSFALYELRDHHAAEDATERTFLRAFAALPRFEERGGADATPRSTFRVWLFQIARNVIANERRIRRRQPVASLDVALAAGLVIADPIDLETESTVHEDAAAALRSVNRLPDDRRRAVILRFVDEMSTSEIAAVLGRSEGAVRVLIHRALRAVASDLESRRDGPRRR
jgi:RNA polymerase sigma-70 factor, ECF subfamily